jgi:hypothetical protein
MHGQQNVKKEEEEEEEEVSRLHPLKMYGVLRYSATHS